MTSKNAAKVLIIFINTK